MGVEHGAVPAVEAAGRGFEVVLATGAVAVVPAADAYQPEGPLITFFTAGSSRSTIDSWSTRQASFRAADVVAIRRVERAGGTAAGARARLQVVA